MVIAKAITVAGPSGHYGTVVAGRTNEDTSYPEGAGDVGQEIANLLLGLEGVVHAELAAYNMKAAGKQLRGAGLALLDDRHDGIGEATLDCKLSWHSRVAVLILGHFG
eukprot:GDKJ01042472.1.p2 GENE.GDKJ01042472.1~~GDKJ01042472.1.p2  ORF type:complete len:108 (+),score=5.23 GDKJ01042472.1:80-403(+)